MTNTELTTNCCS